MSMLAYRSGIHRTVHAGEDGPADQVRFALEHLFAERIGHGYHVVEDDALYRRCLDMDVNFEACQNSSLLTGAVMDRTVKHPVVGFAEDGANFSINRDDSALIQKTLDDDYELLRSLGLNDLHFTRALAYRSGIHRTVHAGEDGPADQVRFALEHLFAERIGHGYHVVEDDALYRRCLDMDVHFEACPNSSLLTGAVMDRTVKHPVVRFAEDGSNFSINRDDSALIQKTLDDDYELLRSLGLNDLHFTRANFNAARSAFLPEDERRMLIEKLMNAYGVVTL